MQGTFCFQFDVTNHCNLRCRHCYHPHHRNQGALTLLQWQGIIAQAAELLKHLHRRPTFVIGGGEPLLSALTLPLIAALRQRWPRAPIAIITNGTHLDQARVAALAKNDVRVQISLDGSHASAHDYVRGAGVFDQVCAAVKRCQTSALAVRLSVVLSQRTAVEIDALFDLAAKLKVTHLTFTRLVPVGAAVALQEKPLQGLALKHAYQKIMAASVRTQVATQTHKPLFHLLDDHLGSSGGFGRDAIVVDYRGHLKISSRIDETLGSVVAGGLVKLFLKHPTLRQLRLARQCRPCPYNWRCGGDRNVAKAVTGSWFARDPGCWLGAK